MKKSTQKQTPLPTGLAQPAQRALANERIYYLEQFGSITEKEIQNWHGIGPNALKTIRTALLTHGLKFAEEKRTDHNVNEYISKFTKDVQAILQKLRQTIQKSAPHAKEEISYQMPAYRQNGILIYFGAWKKHIGIYPPISGNLLLEKALATYAGPKGNLLFPLDQPMPLNLIKRIVKLRIKQDKQKTLTKK